jgi:uncharacterized coiled-coil protein SlyX
MAAIFQLRRGSGSVSLVDGELYVNKGIESLQYQVDDKQITLAKLDEPNTGSLNLYGDITASNLYVTGNVRIDGKITIGDTTADDTLNIVASLSSSLIPSHHKAFDLGSSTTDLASLDNRWYKNLYVETISSSFISGAIAGIGSLEVFSQSVDNRLDRVEASASLYDNAMSGSKRLYVSPSGSDANDGSDPSVPFRTIKAAVEHLGSAVFTNTKRYTIFVGSGEYTEQNPIAVPPGVAIVGDTLRTVRLTAANPTKDFFHVHDSNYFYGLRFLNLQNPAFAFSFPASTATSTISGGGISTISVVHSISGYTDGTNQDLGIIIEGPNISGSTATATANVVGGVITQINVVNGGTNYVNGEKPHISIPAPLSKRPIIGTSPYIQNCSSITGPFTTDGVLLSLVPGNANYAPLPYNVSDVRNESNVVIGSGVIDEQGAGGGIRIDGNLVHPLSPLESFVADAFTQVNQGGPGHLVINKGYAQFVSCFTTFCTYGFKTANGGFANISNSVIDFGKEGLVSKTYFPTTYNTGSSLETKTSQVSGFVIDENGAGYTGSIARVDITGGGGVGATAEATVNANGSIDEIVLLTGGSGYTTQPSVTIAAPTGAGAIQATTVAGKALISGVSEMLMALESGSRGIDISSNMILNGVDYLVTDVAVVSGQPNQRRVTTYPAPPSITTNNQIRFHQLSNISTGGLVMEYVGSGVTYNALPKYGGVPIRTKEIIEFAPGRVFYSTVDNIGNLKIGDFFSVNQLTGEVTIDANSFNLSGLNAIGPFRRNGVAVGVVLQEVSNNTTLLNSQGLFGEDTTPTQYAVKEYVQAINTSLDGRIDKLEIASASLNTFSGSTLDRLSNLETTSGSHNGRLNNLESKSASVDTSISNLNLYTSSLNNAIQLTGSTVSFLGDIIVYGTQSIINSENLAVADNMIYLNNGSNSTNVDLGIVGNYNDGTYAHTGIYRDSIDGVWRVFKGYVPEPSGNIDLSEPSYQYADFYANEISASSLVGIGNITAYSTSVNSRLIELETKSGSLDNSVLRLNQFSASVTSSLEKIYQTTSSLNTATQSLYTSASLMTASISLLSSSVVALQAFSGNVNTRFDNLQTYTTSVNSRFTTLGTYTGSVNTRFTEVGVVTASLITSASLVSSSIWHLHQFSSSENGKSATLATYTGSVESRFTSLATISGSLILSASAVSSSVWNLHQFSASATASLVRMTASIEDHEDRITYIEGINGISGGNPLTQLHIFSASAKISIANLETFTSSANTRLTALEVETANLESFTSSINTTIKNKLNADGVLSGSNQVLGGTNIVSASTDSTTVDFTITNGNITANLIGGVVSGSSQVIGILGSLNTFSSSALTRLTALEVETSNLETFTSSINTTIKTRLNAETVVSGSSQITLSSTAGGGTSANVQFGSLGIGMVASGTTGRIDATNDIVAYSSSDRRFKENITPIENALDKINQIGGYEFDWKEENKVEHGYEGHDLGVIAQEIEAIAPELVQTRENGYKAVKYDKLVSVLIEAIKELSAKVDRLENK